MPARRLKLLMSYGLPFYFRKPRTAMEKLRRYSFRCRFQTSGLVRPLVYLFATLSYPVSELTRSMRCFRRIRLSHPTAGLRTWWRIYWMAVSGNIPSVEYAAYDFEDAAKRSLSAEYVYWTDFPAVQMLNRWRGADNLQVQDKGIFAGICAQLGVPYVRSIAEFRRGRQERIELPADETDLWVKALNLSGSRGAEHWIAGPEGYLAHDGRLMTREQLQAYLQTMDCLVQRRLRNHPQIDDLTNGRLASLRIVTALHRDGRSRLLGNTLLLARRGVTSTGGVSCGVAWSDGTIFSVIDHPEAKSEAARLSPLGRTVPFWAEALELVQHAHRVGFPKFVTLGWDVALTPDGPVLLEANSGWGALALQQVFGPLGLTPLSEVVEEELAARRS